MMMIGKNGSKILEDKNEDQELSPANIHFSKAKVTSYN